jgi:membrane fusion protein, multidrug efflux system
VVTEDIRAVGSLQPNESVVVAPEIAGRIAAIRFREGEPVAAGAVLVELDSGILRAELAKARSDLTLAQANHQRAITLANQGIGTLRARDEAVAALQVEQANVALAEARLEKTVVASPFDGLAGLRAVSVGAFVTPGARIVEIAYVDPIKVDFRVPELALPALRPGSASTSMRTVWPGRTFDGTIYAIDPIVDPNGRAVRLRARVPNPDGALSPGLFARVRIAVGRREAAILVPESAVFVADGRTLVYRLADGRATLAEVTLGQRLPGRVEVVAGLAAGDIVITAGHQQLRDGLKVEVVRPRAGT